jgi:soluble lytic murein transglycosylase
MTARGRAGLGVLLSRAGLLCVAAAFGGCRGGSNVAPAVLTAQSAAEPKAAPAPEVPHAPVLRVVLGDPRLAHAKQLEDARDWAGAAKALREARPAELTPSERCGWDFVEGRLELQADALAEADAAFLRADAPACPLAPWARLRAAQTEARAGHADDAIARARAVPEDIAAARDEVRLVLAESLAAKGDRAGALPLWRAWLRANPHGPRWVDTSVRIANALLDGIGGPAEEHAGEALDLTTRVVVEAPKLADDAGAVAARKRAVSVLRAKHASVSDALALEDRAKQAQAWLDLGEATKAFELASAVLKAPKPAGVACRAAITRAKAAMKAKAIKLDAWPDALKACDKDEQLVRALYSGAKAHAGKDPKLAIEWFGKLEKRFPGHRLADDARYRAALLVADSADPGHEERSDQMLRTLPDAYPAGDMRTEALFRVALGAMKAGRWKDAAPLLEKISELTPDDRHWATAGRAAYFRARVSEQTGDVPDARARYARIIEGHPLAYYMLLAHARLSALDAAEAGRVLKAAIARDAGGSFPSKAHPVLGSPGAVRAMRLLEVGEIDEARRELSAAGVLADDVDPEVVWIAGALFEQAGAPDIGHSFSRSRLTEFLSHYPEGKWRARWQVAYPRAFEPYVRSACTKNALSPTLAWAIMREESSFVPDAKSHSNAIGLMQLIAPTARWMASGTSISTDEASLKKPAVSIELGVKLLSKLRATHAHPALAIGAYNSGSGAINRWVASRTGDDVDLFVELIPYDETRNYVKRVLSSQAAYAYLYDPPALAETLALPARITR